MEAQHEPTVCRGLGDHHPIRAVLQALVQAETTSNFRKVFQVLCQIFVEQPNQRSCLAHIVTQVHKNYAGSIESAKTDVFPFSRPVNDYCHLCEKEKTIQCEW